MLHRSHVHSCLYIHLLRPYELINLLPLASSHFFSLIEGRGLRLRKQVEVATPTGGEPSGG